MSTAKQNGPGSPANPARRVARPVTAPEPTKAEPKSDATLAPKPPDSLRTLMPAGELGVRNPSEARPSTESGGTSGAEDTSRAAGYVADLATQSVAQPGPAVAKDPSLFAGPEAITPPPVDPAKAADPKAAAPPSVDPQIQDDPATPMTALARALLARNPRRNRPQ